VQEVQLKKVGLLPDDRSRMRLGSALSALLRHSTLALHLMNDKDRMTQ